MISKYCQNIYFKKGLYLLNILESLVYIMKTDLPISDFDDLVFNGRRENN